MFNMPTLPYAHNALEPVISQATIDFHYGKHFMFIGTVDLQFQIK